MIKRNTDIIHTYLTCVTALWVTQ